MLPQKLILVFAKTNFLFLKYISFVFGELYFADDRFTWAQHASVYKDIGKHVFMFRVLLLVCGLFWWFSDVCVKEIGVECFQSERNSGQSEARLTLGTNDFTQSRFFEAAGGRPGGRRQQAAVGGRGAAWMQSDGLISRVMSKSLRVFWQDLPNTDIAMVSQYCWGN